MNIIWQTQGMLSDFSADQNNELMGWSTLSKPIVSHKPIVDREGAVLKLTFVVVVVGFYAKLTRIDEN